MLSLLARPGLLLAAAAAACCCGGGGVGGLGCAAPAGERELARGLCGARSLGGDGGLPTLPDLAPCLAPPLGEPPPPRFASARGDAGAGTDVLLSRRASRCTAALGCPSPKPLAAAMILVDRWTVFQRWEGMVSCAGFWLEARD